MIFDVNKFPSGPGVYVMKGANGAVLYIGKAANLHKRVASYFKCEALARYQIKFLMEKVADIDFTETRNEKEAILLEYKLIQKYKPKYNIDLKDNKTFVRIRLSAEHPFPAISVTRKINISTPRPKSRGMLDIDPKQAAFVWRGSRGIKKDGAEYFGPYTSAGACRDMVDQAVKFFGLRTCSDREFVNRSRPCIQYEIGRCMAPCAGRVTKEDYAYQIENVRLFLKGKRKDLIRSLKGKMKAASKSLQYEAAAHFRNLISDLQKSLQRQDVMKADEGPLPSVAMVENDGYDAIIGTLLRKKFRLSMTPHLIECVDISNISGRIASGAIVCFLDGAPIKSRYRLFNIDKESDTLDGGYKCTPPFRSPTPGKNGKMGGANDYAMMYEVLERRFRRTEWGVPDLLIVDGGRGQLSVACKVLSSLNLKIPVAAVAKIEGSHKKSSDEAQIFIPNRVNPIKFKKGEPALLYLIRIRDEAHRFGIRHYRRRHRKTVTGIAR